MNIFKLNKYNNNIKVILTLLLLLLLLLTAKCMVANVVWHNVKPMHLVAMFSEPTQLSTIKSSSDETTIFNIDSEYHPIMDEEVMPTDADDDEGSEDEAMDRIFGGNVAHRNCFPYQVGFLLQRPKGLYWCGGSLISDEFILTAAHCVDMAKRALVFLGAHQIKNANEYGQLRIMVQRSNFILFPTWNPRRLKDDIAVVHLPRPIEFTEKIHPIQLPKRSFEYRSFRDKLAIASGWGRYATGKHAISNELRFVKLKIIDGATCKSNFPLSYRSTNICTSGQAAKSTCNGDSGGPLVLRYRNSKKHVLIGLTSFGSIFGCDKGFPAAYTKVAAYLDWINDVTGVDSQHETTNTMFFNKSLKAFKHKVLRHRKPTYMKDEQEDFEGDDDDDDVNIEYENMEMATHADAKLMHAPAAKTVKNKRTKYQIFIFDD